MEKISQWDNIGARGASSRYDESSMERADEKLDTQEDVEGWKALIWRRRRQGGQKVWVRGQGVRQQ